ncbi:MAG: 2-oxo acid dehydrogenase subunit E2 [Candidatus Eisenbacteria bacterium]|nr:2-oxo acid dehydrogenase subunit E2 [Candidatus Eisenbacteria bacterium]
MPYEVKLPDIGEGIAEGEIVRWLVKPGDRVREDQPLVEVMTDKASVEIPAPRTGTIAALLAEEGQMVPVGSVIVTIALVGEAAGAAPAPASPPAAQAAASTPATLAAPPAAPAGAPPSAAAAPAAPAAASRVQAVPAVRQLAKQLGVDLERVAGSGPGGRITAGDVERTAAAGAGPAPAAVARSDDAAASGTPARGAAPAPAGDEERVPLRGLRRKIAEHMSRSVRTAAHFTFVAECDMSVVVAQRAQLLARAGTEGVRLTYLAWVVKALIQPLRDFPLLNASLDDERQEIVLKRSLHLGIATATAEGLTVPVIHDAGRLTLFGLAREIQRLSEAARAHRLELREIQGATFTVTSTGAHCGVLATPILHHPQVDGAVGADFLYAVIERLEHPETWLSESDIG